MLLCLCCTVEDCRYCRSEVGAGGLVTDGKVGIQSRAVLDEFPTGAEIWGSQHDSLRAFACQQPNKIYSSSLGSHVTHTLC